MQIDNTPLSNKELVSIVKQDLKSLTKWASQQTKNTSSIRWTEVSQKAQDILQKIGVKAEECLMVGNDVNEDMVAANLGMRVFLLTDCLINRDGKDISVYPNGSFEELKEFISKL
jgi:methionine salvage enolase-phosphatase E1